MPLQSVTIRIPYLPAGLFEAQYTQESPDAALTYANGCALAVLKQPTQPLPDHVVGRVRDLVHLTVESRGALAHQATEVGAAGITYTRDDGADLTLLAIGVESTAEAADHIDHVHMDAAGNVLYDSKAARIAELDQATSEVVEAVNTEPRIRPLLESIARAATDHGNELLHLYEVRDGLAKLFGGEHKARRILGISKADWARMGTLANTTPLEQSRHRGTHLAGRRPATPEELRDARALARGWLLLAVRAIKASSGR